jgi:hypothetical protein
MYPMEGLTRAAMHSRKTYPHTPLRLHVEALGGVIKPVLDRNCSIGVIGSLPLVPDEQMLLRPYSFRHLFGVVPTIALNVRLKAAWSEKPVWRAMSGNVLLEWSRSVFAIATRCKMR